MPENDSWTAPGEGGWRASPLRPVVAEFAGLLEGAHVGMGEPPAHETDWLRFEELASLELGERVIRQVAQHSGATEQVAATYTLRYAVYYPLLWAGYLFARQQRVAVLRGNVALAERDWLNWMHLRAPVIVAQVGDPLAGQAGNPPVADERQLADALFGEVTALVGPLIEAWSAAKLVARPNAWAAALDALAYGFQLAGRSAIGLDAAWEKWSAAIEGRIFPVRRRPRRFIFHYDGETDELLVRAGCCLWYTLPAAKRGEAHYCTSCYLESDERRREQMVAYLRRQKAEKARAGE